MASLARGCDVCLLPYATYIAVRSRPAMGAEAVKWLQWKLTLCSHPMHAAFIIVISKVYCQLGKGKREGGKINMSSTSPNTR